MESIFILLVLLFSVVIHEVSHGYAALALGDNTAKYQGRLTLNPIKHLDPVGSFLVPLLGYFTGGVIIGWAKPVPFNPYNLRNQKWGEGLVAIAGPISNILIAAIFALIIRSASANGFVSEPFFFLTGYLVFINIILALFNMIPIPPLDGSKVLFALLPYRLQALRQGLERYGLVLVFIFVFTLWRFLTPMAGTVFAWLVGTPFF
jgi:Zn-dependent protease